MEKYSEIFSSKNILYVKLNKNLVDEYLFMVNDHSVQEGISHKRKLYTYAQEIEWLEKKLKENAIIFSMIEKNTEDYIGNIEIMHINNDVGEIGIAITPKKQNNHYGQESMKAITDYALNVLNLKNVDLNVYKTNIRAIKCYEKVGFIAVGDGKTSEDLHMVYRKR